MKPPLSSKMVEKALAAMTSAVEVYNRPSFAYREETFALLALNAWELLLKAKLVKDNGNSPKAIWIYEPRPRKGGGTSQKLYLKRNRAGNPLTLGVLGCIRTINGSPKPLDVEVTDNLHALVAIRDNAAHYFSASRQLAAQAAEIATATVKNFVLVAKDWFGEDFSERFTLCLPLAFLSGPAVIQAVVTGREQRLIDYLSSLSAKQTQGGDFAVALRMEVKLDKSQSPGAVKIQHSKDPDAIKVNLSEEDIRKQYPWDYRQLTEAVRKKVPNFLENQEYHDIRKGMESNPKFAHARYLDPSNTRSSKRTFYNPNFVAEIAKVYDLLG